MATHPSLQAFQVPKVGESEASCEDAFALPALKGCGLPPSFRIGLSDGATTCSGSRLWARILARAAVESLVPPTRPHYFLRKLDRLRDRWRETAGAALPTPRPWFAEAALERGAYATWLRLRVCEGEWAAEALGDSCLFHFRGRVRLLSFPLQAPEDFEAAPDLLASVPGHDRGLDRRFRTASGRLQSGDRLVLATDAVACRLVKDDTWPTLLERLEAPDAKEAFSGWVQEERAAGRMKNDDSTLILIRIP